MIPRATHLGVSLGLLALGAGARPASEGSDSWQLRGPRAIEVGAEGERAVAGVLAVGLADPADRAAVLDLVRARGGVLTGEIPRLGALAVSLPSGADAGATAAEWSALPGVRYAERIGVGEGGGAPPPDDTHFAEQWHLENTGQSGGSPGADLEVLPAWDLEPGDPGVVVAVLDTGVDFAHPDLQGRLLPGHDYVNEDGDATADDPHGVWVSGLLAAVADNGLGTAGVDRGCSVLPVKVLDVGAVGTTFDLAQGIDWAVAQGADVLSMSLVNYPYSMLVEDALSQARAAGVVPLACSGNLGIGNADVSFPGASPHTISIGWTNKLDQRVPASGTGSALDFVAPGANLATIAIEHEDGFGVFTGCSAATPVAAGVVSLLLAFAGDLDADDVYALLLEGAEDEVGDPSEDVPGWDPFHGHGRLNARATLAAACACAGPQPLVAAPSSLSIEKGGKQTLQLDAGAEHALDLYLVLGSASGTEPGLVVDGLPLPLNYDDYLWFTLGAPNSGVLWSFLGLLDASGAASAAFNVEPGTVDASLAGVLFHHAFVVVDVDGSQTVTFTSNAASLQIETLDGEVLSEDFEDGGDPAWSLADPQPIGASSGP